MDSERSMRLSQAARILNRNHSAVASILAAKGYKVDNNPNTRLNGEQLDFLAREFKAEALLGEKTINKGENGVIAPPATSDATPALTPIPQKTPNDLALERIKEFLKTDQTSLNLSDLGLESIPAELKSLKKIKKLSLANNRLKTIENIPDSVIELDLSNNLLSNTQGLSKQVVFLKLNGNRLSDIELLPNSIQQLEVNHNDIHQVVTFPKSLKYLKINHNQLENIQLPATLESLAICHNKLTQVPEFPKKLKELYLYGNPISGIQPDILGENENTNCLRTIKNYLAELGRRSEPNRNVKLVLVGNSNVGKSSLLRALKDLP